MCNIYIFFMHTYGSFNICTHFKALEKLRMLVRKDWNLNLSLSLCHIIIFWLCEGNTCWIYNLFWLKIIRIKKRSSLSLSLNFVLQFFFRQKLTSIFLLFMPFSFSFLLFASSFYFLCHLSWDETLFPYMCKCDVLYLDFYWFHRWTLCVGFYAFLLWFLYMFGKSRKMLIGLSEWRVALTAE